MTFCTVAMFLMLHCLYCTWLMHVLLSDFSLWLKILRCSLTYYIFFSIFSPLLFPASYSYIYMHNINICIWKSVCFGDIPDAIPLWGASQDWYLYRKMSFCSSTSVNLSSGGGILLSVCCLSKQQANVATSFTDLWGAGGRLLLLLKQPWKVRVICHNHGTEVSPAAPVSQAVGDVFGKAGAVMGAHLGPSKWMICREKPLETWANSVLWSRSESQNQRQNVGFGSVLGFSERWLVEDSLVNC